MNSKRTDQPTMATARRILAAAAGLFLILQAAVAADGAAKSGPTIQFVQPVYDFGTINSGEVVKHDFVFTNTGNQPLEITNVQTTCGCTAAGEWDRKVAPGKSGTIPIQFNSAGYSGLVYKTVTVTCNDPAQPAVMLQVNGNVWKPIDVMPTFAMFNPGPDGQTNETRVIRIVSKLQEPLTLSPPEGTNKAFAAEIRTVRPGKEFELLVTMLAPVDPAPVPVPITIRTSSTNAPVVSVTAYAMTLPVLSITPNQITLPPGPLTNAAQFTVNVQNNSTNSLVLSDPAVNAKGATVTVREVLPGRRFDLAITFPVGFQAAPGQTIEVTAKANDVRVPRISVQAVQPPPAPSAAAPAAPAPSPGNTSTAGVSRHAAS